MTPARRCGRAAGVATTLVIGLAGSPASAHQSAVKYLDLDVRGTDAVIELRFQPSDVTRPLGLADDALPTVDEALAGAAKVVPYIAPWIVVRNGATECAPSAPALDRAAADPRFLAIRWTARCARPIERLVLDLAGFFAVDRTHEMLLHLTSAETDPYDTTIGIAGSPVSLALGEDTPSSALGWIWRGVVESYTGPAHVAFVLALVLIVVIARDRDGTWTARPGRAAVASAAAALGALVIGHGLAVVADANDWVWLPPRLAGAMVGLAIAYLAIEDALAPAVRWRFAVAFGFGLVHGLAAASAFAAVVPPDGGLAPLVELDLGVALGQLSVAAATLPTLALLARVVGPARYRRLWVPIGAALLASLGIAWFVAHAVGARALGL